MTTPKLDGRTAKDILALVGEKSRAYTPEWHFDPADPDGGTALAMLFSEMFSGTVERLDRFPDKCSIEFLNMLGVCAKPVSPAVGTAAARLVEGASQRVFIKKGTQLFTDKDDERIVFETTQGYFAVPAELTDIFMTDPSRDVITRTPMEEGVPADVTLFRPQPDMNAEKHRFSVAQDNALSLSGATEISMRVTAAAGSRDDSHIKALCSPDCAQWSMVGERGIIPLSARQSEGCIILTKPEGRAIPVNEDGEPDEEGHFRVFCEMRRTEASEPITADNILLSSRSVDEPETMTGRLPDSLFANDTELPVSGCGYVFGKEPNAYDAFYIGSSEVFSKAGAEISLELWVSTVVSQNGETDAEPDFEQKLLVDKGELKPQTPDDISISDVIWEYWNGYGWARLEVGGDIDLFACSGRDGRRRITFTCPADIAMSVQNACNDLWIRARVREVKNRFSMNGRWLLPLVKSVELRFDYGTDYVQAVSVSTLNSCRRCEYTLSGAGNRMELFTLMPDSRRTVYFRFDQPPCGYPVNIWLGFESETDTAGELSFSYYAGGQTDTRRWRELKTVDRTDGFCSSGLISMYIPEDMAQAELFGEQGYWIRVEEPLGADGTEPFPALRRIEMNAVEVVQRISVSGERRSLLAGKKFQQTTLSNTPVIDCEVWVNELGESPLSELQELMRQNSSQVRVINGEDGQPAEWWVKWRETESLSGCGSNERCYELDRASGRLTFGDGVYGRIPAYSSDPDLSVDYSYGGGTRGNLPAGGLDGLITGIPFVESMTNICPTCGGSDEQSIETVRRIGAQRLRHGGRAVTVRDHEGLIMEEFSEVGEVRCFPGRNRRCEAEPGCVTVVVKPADNSSAAYSAALCRKIDAFLRQRGCCEPVMGGRLAVIPAKKLTVSAEVSVVIRDYEYAVQTERDIAAAIDRLTASAGIGTVICEADIYAALKGTANIAYISRVLLSGEYYSGGKAVTIPLDRPPEYRYFLPVSGSHTVRIDGQAER